MTNLAVGTILYGWSGNEFNSSAGTVGSEVIIYTTTTQLNTAIGDKVYNIYGEEIDTVTGVEVFGDYERDLSANNYLGMWESSQGTSLDTTVQANTKYISNLSDGTDTYVIKDVEARTSITNKQDILVSGTNIKTVGGTTLLGSGNIAFPTVDQTYSAVSTNAQSGVAVKSAIDAAISSVYKPGGSVAFASLPTLGSTNEGYVYNVTDAFTTTSSFVEGAGVSYPAGTNVAIVITDQTNYYAWYLTSFSTLVYTTSATPSPGDAIYNFEFTLTDDTIKSVESDYSSILWKSDGVTLTATRQSSNDTNSTTYKFDTLTGAFQPLLVSGTNIKTVNNESILGSGNINISSGSTYTAGTGIDITNNAINVTSPVLINTSTGNNSITILGTKSSITNAMNIGYSSSVTRPGIAIGNNSSISGNENWACVLGTGAGAESARCGVAIGSYAQVKANYAIQIGGSLDTTSAVNSEANTMKVYNGISNYKLLGSDGTIPNTRLNVMTGSDGTNAGTKGAVPAPTATDNTKFLRGDGTWATPTMPTVDQTYDGTSTNAQSGTAIAGAGFLTNKATSPYSWVISNTASGKMV